MYFYRNFYFSTAELRTLDLLRLKYRKSRQYLYTIFIPESFRCLIYLYTNFKNLATVANFSISPLASINIEVTVEIIIANGELPDFSISPV